MAMLPTPDNVWLNLESFHDIHRHDRVVLPPLTPSPKTIERRYSEMHSGRPFMPRVSVGYTTGRKLEIQMMMNAQQNT